MIRKINGKIYKVNAYASSMLIEVDSDTTDAEIQKMKKLLQLESYGCYGFRLNLLVCLAKLTLEGYTIFSVTEFNVDGSKPRVAYANSKDFKKIVKYLSNNEKK